MRKNILQQFLDSHYPVIKLPFSFVFDIDLTDNEKSSGTAKNISLSYEKKNQPIKACQSSSK